MCIMGMLLPCCIEHKCVGQCFQRHSGNCSLPHKIEGVPSAAHDHSGRPERESCRSKIRIKGREPR